jgi:predicted nucleic acid-binding protein
MEDLSEALGKHQRIALDSKVLLYYFEAHPEYGPLSRTVMRAVADGLMAVAPVLTLMDALVMPYRLKNHELAEQHLVCLTTFPNLSLIAIDREIAGRAALLRAHHPILRAPDALTIACGLAHNATLFVTNDSRHLQLPEMPVLNLREMLD